MILPLLLAAESLAARISSDGCLRQVPLGFRSRHGGGSLLARGRSGEKGRRRSLKARTSEGGDGDDDGGDESAGSLVTARTCPDVTALDRRACGDPGIDECHCKQLGCCWAGDDPFTSTLQNEGWHGVSACYYLFGGFHAITPQMWSVPVGQSYNLSFPSIPAADAAKVRFLIVPGDATCGSSSISPDVQSNGAAPVGKTTQTGDGKMDLGVVVSNVQIIKPGKYNVCMNDDKIAQGLDDDVFFTVFAGKIDVYEEIAEVLGPCSTALTQK